jgi:hypothetical protein
MEREPEQNRDEQHLENFTLGEGIDDGVRDDVEDELGGGAELARPGVGRDALGVQGGRIDVHAAARPHHVHQHQADDQRDRAHHLEVDQCEAAGLADLLHVLHAGDAGHDGAEDDGGNHHLDQLDETVAERPHLGGELGPEVPKQDAYHHRHKHLDIKRAVDGLLVRCDVGQSHERSP